MPATRSTIRRLLAVLAPLLVALMAASPAHAGASAVTGVAFKDLDRDGVRQPAEPPLAGKRIHLFDAAGNYVENALTGDDGTYTIGDLADGRYLVQYSSPDWWDLWRDWAPSTTGSERPRVEVEVAGGARADFGFRPIVRSTDPGAPISTYVSPEGLRVESFNDVVAARSVYDALMAGSLHGAETASTTIRFGLQPSNFCDISAVRSGGVWGGYRATCYLDYVNWLNLGDNGLFHEYGHAWSLYHAYVVQQDPNLTAYLEARGLAGDPRIGSSVAWSPREMIAEDYRQLFGTADAAAGSQDNLDIPRASEVPGLRAFLSGAFMEAPPAPVTPALHVGDLRAQAVKSGRGWAATATVAVHGADERGVAGATVTLRWTAGKTSGERTCVTDGSGSCSVALSLATKVDQASFRVTSVARDGYDYASGADHSAAYVTVARPR